MARGDVTCEVVVNTSGNAQTAMNNLYVSGNDKWLMTDVYNGSKVLICHIEEAS